MTTDTCGGCGKSVNRKKAIWILDRVATVDPVRAWDGGPVILCPRCAKARPGRIEEYEKRVARKVKIS